MTDGSVDSAAVAHVAALARVDLDENETEEFAAQFADVLDYFETLDEVSDVESEPDLTNVLRTDEAREGLSQDEALKNAPETDEGYFEGPPVG